MMRWKTQRKNESLFNLLHKINKNMDIERATLLEADFQILKAFKNEPSWSIFYLQNIWLRQSTENNSRSKMIYDSLIEYEIFWLL